MNVAEKLKNCPEGTKLYSTIWGEVTFIKVNGLNNIEVKDRDGFRQVFYPDGKYSILGEVVLFPSMNQRDWSEFVIPFKDGDVIITTDKENRNIPFNNMAIFKEYNINETNKISIYCQFNAVGKFLDYSMNVNHSHWRKATDEERKEFFEKLHKEGYDFVNGSLVKIIKPKFKVGDIITDGSNQFVIVNIDNDYYYEIKPSKARRLLIEQQNKWELVKFDPKLLQPFQKVLVRNYNNGTWGCSFFGYINDGRFIATNNIIFNQCVPYNKDTAHLVGTSDACPEYYKTW